jgi:hypothetical protein
MHLHRAVRLTALLGILAACAGPGPHRSAQLALTGPDLGALCGKLYRDTDTDIHRISTDFAATNAERAKFLANMEDRVRNTPKALQPCWRTAFEPHDDYDLYFVEVDDAGQTTDTARGVSYPLSELHLVESRLLGALRDPSSAFDVVVFTHGWHGDAEAINDYTTEFKGVLMDVAQREAAYQANLGARTLASGPAAADRRLRHRVVGVEIAWRGDSLLNPGLPFYPAAKNSLNVLDRKMAARTIAEGAPQRLLAFLNEIYLDHSCHGAAALEQPSSCDRMHLMSIGHSFGALINFEALIPRLESGLNVRRCFRAYSFGDMTILLNPAFEGARYRPLFDDAVNRPQLIGPYFGGPGLGDCPTTRAAPGQAAAPEVQIPTIVTLQSLGDTATGEFFPIMRTVTTPFDQVLSPSEAQDKRLAIGWDPSFRTHTLEEAGEADACVNAKGVAALSFCPFGVRRNDVTGRTGPKPMRFTLQPPASLPDYLPLWSVAVSKEIMRDHDDFWNPQIIRMVSLLFTDAYEQSDRMHGSPGS